MNLENPMKQELQGASFSYSCGIWSAIPQPIEGLNGIHTPPFLNKTYDLVDDPITSHIVSWSRGNNSFVVWDPQSFATNLLPKYFKHNNFSSFVRQLNTYGFRKVDPDKWEFANEWFMRGQRHLLKNLRRRKIPQPQMSYQGNLDSCLEVGRLGLDLEVDRLRRGKQVLVTELVKLRQHHHTTKCYLKEMEERIKRTEMKQQHMMNFLATAIHNPSFVQQFVDKRKEIEEARSKKRTRTINQGPRDVMLECHDNTRFGVLEGTSGTSKNLVEEFEENMGNDSGDKALDEGFWGGFLNDRIEEETGLFGVVEDDDDLDMLAQQFDFLDSTST